MTYDGETISLKPSIGNWSFNCKSHYWITNNEVEWSLKWADDTIREVRAFENSEREEYYRNKNSDNAADEIIDSAQLSKPNTKKESWFEKLIFWK